MIESEGSSDDDASIAYGHDINEGWDPSAHLIPPQSGARIISIKAQSPALQAVVKAAIRDVMGDALFLTTYPSPITVVDYICDTLRTNANRLNFSALSDRFAEDRKFVETISHVVCRPILILLIFLTFDYSWLFVFLTSVVALRK